MLQTAIRRYLRHGTLPQLRVFEAAARHGSLTRAAEELHMAQPTASIQIKKLTETVGMPLFEQIGKRVHLTDAGRLLYSRCEDMFRLLVDLEQRMNQLRTTDAGRLRLAVCSAGKYFAPRILGAFVGRHPAVEVALEIQNRRVLLERLARNEDDLYLFASPLSREGVVTQVLLPNPLVVVARDDHPLAGAGRVDFARIAEEPFVMREDGSGTRMLALQAFERHAAVPRIRLETGTDEAVREAVLAGLGVAITSRYTLGHESAPSRLVCLDVEGFPLENHWHFAYPVGKELSPTARAFMDFARVEARRLALEAASAGDPRPLTAAACPRP